MIFTSADFEVSCSMMCEITRSKLPDSKSVDSAFCWLKCAGTPNAWARACA